MRQELAREIIACLPKGRTGFRYYRDRYAPLLLAAAIPERADVSTLKRSPFATLLQKAPVCELLSRSGDGVLRNEQLKLAWQEPSLPFLLSLGVWGSMRKRYYFQTSRAGYNLVLRLNFSRMHDAAFQRLLKPATQHRLRFQGHPVNRPGQTPLFRETLAWARIDVDFHTGEALIEELQSDWVRAVQRWLHRFRVSPSPEAVARQCGLMADSTAMERYAGEILAPYSGLWHEAMLSATVDFIHRELGIERIYTHSVESGARMKKIDGGGQPPTSIYRELPKRFCFKRTTQPPAFLRADTSFRRQARMRGHGCWQRLDLGGLRHAKTA